MVSKQLGRDPSEFTAETDLAEAGYESLDVIETVFAVEEEFNIDISFNANSPDTLELRTVGDIVSVVEAMLAKQKPA
ncbi:acyl carrier protein [Sphingobium limneticum]|nr:acyl carrier protein [Sphingobium limneticum]